MHHTIFQFTVSFLSMLILTINSAFTAELKVPAHTAYMLPDADSARISEQHGVTHWDDPTQSVNWYGRFQTPGKLHAKVELRLPSGAKSILQLTIGDQSRSIIVTGQGEETVAADFGPFEIKTAGHHRVSLSTMNKRGSDFGDLLSLTLSGDAVNGAHFNLKERRNAASVHLAYPVEDGIDVEAFYCEATGLEEPVATYYMACGWHRGYFGMQVNSESERRIIFSVWDSGDEAVDRDKVDNINRVTLMGKSDGVFSGDFGNEGTGGHSHLKYMWKTGEPQRFFVTAQPIEKTFTIYSGYWFHPATKQWMLISSWKAPKEGGYMRGLYSFSENFDGQNGHLLRKATFGNQWIRTPDQKWTEITSATFSHDPTGKADRLDRYMGVENGQFFLSHGGFLDGFTEYGTRFDRPATGRAPNDLILPKIKL